MRVVLYASVDRGTTANLHWVYVPERANVVSRRLQHRVVPLSRVDRIVLLNVQVAKDLITHDMNRGQLS